MGRQNIFWAFALLPSVTAAQQDSAHLFHGVNLVTLDAEEVLPGQTVLITERRIAAMGPEGTVTAPPDAVAIDAGLAAIATWYR
ncbi:MAG: hypothetical protein OXJ56_16420 [Rhodospirillaceae bacterium]|nr:hypothetical protein [Rhodospirillaceae bacterium]MDE0361446.1 hypothetical protein [Rhodospirillaceae bacterium]